MNIVYVNAGEWWSAASSLSPGPRSEVSCQVTDQAGRCRCDCEDARKMEEAFASTQAVKRCQ